MMKKIGFAALTLAMTAAVGCNRGQNNSLSEVPPPPQPAPAPVAYEPVSIEPAPAPVPAYEPVPVAPPLDTMPAAGGTYTVEKGDTIYSIARKLYGNNQMAKQIIAANPGIDPNKIKVGQTLNLPQ